MNILLAMIPAFFWGTTYAVTQFTLPDWPPVLLGALRALPAGLLLLAIKPSLPKKQDWKILLVLGTINIALFFGLIFLMALTLPSAISALGMIGTVIGLVQMLQTMSDPSSIGPAMAVALITTFYGAVLANLVFIPMAGKLKSRSNSEIRIKEMQLEGVLAISRGENPRILQEKLSCFQSISDRVSAA